MRPNYAKQIRAFLQSTEATASAFSSIGWDETRHVGSRDYWCLVKYGILEEMELDVVLEGGSWFVQLYVPPILPEYEEEVARICDDLQARYSPLVATVDVDRAVLLGAMGEGDPMHALRRLWQVFGEEDVYEAVLLFASLTAPTEDDLMAYDVPDDPYGDDE